jgi:clan AA aspartic protease
MLNGIVNAQLEPRLALTIKGAGSRSCVVDAIVDTGFNGFLTLPPEFVAMLGLEWLCRQEGQLADGSVHPFDVYGAVVMWDGTPRTIEVEMVDAQPLIGMSLMSGCDLQMHIADGGSVFISPSDA